MSASEQKAPALAGAMNPAPVYGAGREIARGGMGAVLDAHDHKFGRKVAMKVMLHGEASAAEQQRFLQEARVLSHLAHPNIVPVYDLGADARGRLFYTMKLVEGVTLHDVILGLQAGDKEMLAKYSLNALLTVFQKACDAVAFAHSRGIIHRDLKPQNIMLGRYGEVLVVDWGLAKILPGSPAAVTDEALFSPAQFGHSGLADALPLAGETPGPGRAVNNAAYSETVADGAPSSFVARAEPVLTGGSAAFAPPAGPADTTATPTKAGGLSATLDGTVVGTPHYMSPEQAQGRVNELDARSDIFALGGILYTLLTLRPPVEGSTLAEVLEKVRTGTVMPPSSRSLRARGAEPGAKGRPALEFAKATPLRHLPGGQVPAALSAVAMKALSVDRTQRYQYVAALTADVAAYQAGFATGAENAGALQQLKLLMLRHRTVTALLAALLCLSLGFILTVISSSRERQRLARIAQANERQAIAERETARKSLALSALALADAALRDGDDRTMQAALRQVPADLRDATWSYLLAQSDTSLGPVNTGATELQGVAAHPQRPGVFAVADQQGKVTLLEVRSGTRLVEFKSGFKPGAAAARLAFSPDGERLAVGQSVADGGIVVHRARDGKRLAEWAAPVTKRLEFSPDGQWLLQTEARRAALKMWNPATGQLAWEQKSGDLHDMGAFTPENQVLIHSGKLGLRLVLARDGALVRPLNALLPSSLVIRPDGKMVALLLHRGGIKGLNLADGSTLFEYHPPQFGFRSHQDDDGQLAFTPDGLRLVSVTSLADGRQALQLWDASSGAALPPLLGGHGRANDAAVHPLSGELVVVGAEAKVWDLTGISPKWVLPAPANPTITFWGADDVVFGPDSATQETGALQKLEAGQISPYWKPPGPDRYLASSTIDNRFAMLGPRTGRRAQSGYDIFFLRQPDSRVQHAIAAKPSANLTSLCLSPTGDQWATIQRFHAEVCVYDRNPKIQPPRLNLHDLIWFWDIGWLDRQHLLALATARTARGNPGSEERIVIWDTSTGQIVQSRTNPSAMDVLAIAPDGRRFAESGTGRRVCIRDAATLTVVQEFRAHNDRISALAWHPHRPVIATASEDLSVKLWNLETGQPLQELRGPITPPVRLAFSPSGRRLGCASPNDAVRIWEVE